MAVTAKVKAGFPTDVGDLYQRGARLIEESVENGVTSMRAHVEVDAIVGFSCLDVASKLKARYRDVCDVQIAGGSALILHSSFRLSDVTLCSICAGSIVPRFF